MTFYKSIADHYQHIFPLNHMQVDFIKRSFSDPSSQSLLDIGCATGNLANELSGDFNEIIGIDLDKQMLDIAKNIVKDKSPNIQFQQINMLDIETHFGLEVFDAIICFGNTLVHLTSEELISDFFKQSHKVLKNNGKLLFQIINYDRILNSDIRHLPTIENEYIKFERNYTYHKKKNLIEFSTDLSVKENDIVIKNSINLYPLRKSRIEILLRNAGFRNVCYFSSFKRDNYNPKSIPLIVEVVK